jgi:hypothetical protein
MIFGGNQAFTRTIIGTAEFQKNAVKRTFKRKKNWDGNESAPGHLACSDLLVLSKVCRS